MPHQQLIRRLACLILTLIIAAAALPVSGISSVRAQDAASDMPTRALLAGTPPAASPTVAATVEPTATDVSTDAPPADTSTDAPPPDTSTPEPVTPVADTPTPEPTILTPTEAPTAQPTESPTIEPSVVPFSPVCQAGEQTTSISLDGVALSVCASALPAKLRSAAPDDFAQIASAIKANPYEDFSIEAVPFGVAPAGEDLPAAAPGLAPAYLDALRQFRLSQGAQVKDAPAAALFDSPVPGITSLVNLQIHGDAFSPVVIVEWVAEAGSRLWIVRAAQELTGSEANSQSLDAVALPLSGLVISSADLSATSTSLAAQFNPPPAPEENNEPSAQSSSLPFPSWWSGDCNVNNHSGSYPLGASYRGVKACGPLGSAQYVQFAPGLWGELEWQCVELSMRYMYLAYGIHPYSANGKDVVNNYPGSLLKKIANSTTGKAPLPGDVLSYGITATYGHTSVVTSSNVNSSGDGTITVVEQNASASGTNTLTVSDWYVNPATGFYITGWLHGENPKPSISGLIPSSVDVGSGDIWLEVDGSNFINSSVVRWDGSSLSTTYSSGSKLLALVPASKLTAADTISITVYSPSPGGGTSSSKTFTINNLVPTLSAISPTNVLAGNGTLTLTATGTNFVKTSKVYFNGHALTTTYISPTQLTASLSSTYLTLAGLYPVTVVNPAPGGGASPAQTFTVNNHIPTISSLSPTVATAGNKSFTLTVNGTYMVAGSKVRWNGADLATTYSSGAKLTAAVPADLVALYGTVSVTIFNPTPGGGESTAAAFTINNPLPVLTSITPSQATAGSAATTITLTGANFVKSSLARWDGADLATTYVSATQLSAQATSSLLAAHKWANVTVFNPSPGGASSLPQIFKVISASPTKCVAAGTLAIGSSVSGNNAAAGSTDNIDYYPSVSWDAHAPEFTYLFTAPRAATVAVWLSGATSSLKTILIDGASVSCDTVNTLASGDQLVFTAAAGHAYYVVVDGYLGNISGYQLNVDEFLPYNGSALSMLRPTFYWPKVDKATSYKLQASRSSGFSSLVVNVKTTNNSYAVTSDLPANTRIYWRVLSSTGKYVYMPKGYLSFTSANPPSVPKLSLPANKALVTSYSPVLDWTDSTLPTGVMLEHYQVQVARDVYFTDLVVDDTAGAVSTYPMKVSLPPNKPYYWRVASFGDNGHYSSWSSAFNLRAAMLPPTGLSAANLDMLRPAFSWSAVDGASAYTFQIAALNDFKKPLVSISAATPTFSLTADLPKDTPLFWRVRGEGTNGPSLWSAVGAFRSANPPTIPALASPAKNALLTSYTPTLDWKDAVAPLGVSLDHYQLQVALDSKFTSIVLDKNAGAASNYPVTGSLSPDAKYYWRVAAYGSNGHYSAWSSASYFRIAMDPPALKEPGIGTVLATRRPAFDWGSIPTLPGASSYTIQVSNSISFKTLYLNKTVTASSYTATSSLPAGATLYWRVEANGPNGPSLWSTVASFTTP